MPFASVCLDQANTWKQLPMACLCKDYINMRQSNISIDSIGQGPASDGTWRWSRPTLRNRGPKARYSVAAAEFVEGCWCAEADVASVGLPMGLSSNHTSRREGRERSDSGRLVRLLLYLRFSTQIDAFKHKGPRIQCTSMSVSMHAT